jgi:uridine kinase
MKSGVSVCVLKEKNFFKSVEIQNPQDREHYLKNYDFDNFWAIDWDFFETAVDSLKARKPFNTPIYDIFNSKRIVKTKNQKPSDLIIIEGRLFWNNEKLKNACNIKIFLDSDMDLMLSRRVIKGLIRKIPLEEIVEGYLKNVKPNHEKWVEPTKVFADLVIPNFGSDSLDLNQNDQKYEILQILFDLLEFRLKDN